MWGNLWQATRGVSCFSWKKSRSAGCPHNVSTVMVSAVAGTGRHSFRLSNSMLVCQELQVNILANIYWQSLPRKLTVVSMHLLLQNFNLLLNPNISMKIWGIPILSLPICRGSSTLPLNRAIISIGAMVENPLVVEDEQYFLRQVLRLQTSLAISTGGESWCQFHATVAPTV